MPKISEKHPSKPIITLHTMPEIPNIIGNGHITVTIRTINPTTINIIFFIIMPHIFLADSYIYGRGIESFIKRSTNWESPNVQYDKPCSRYRKFR